MAAASFHKGNNNNNNNKLLLLFLLFGISVISVNCNLLSSNEQEEKESSIDQQENQLKKLESLVKNLTELVTRLESSLPNCQKVSTKPEIISPSKSNNNKVVVVDKRSDYVDVKVSSKDDKVDDGERLRGGASVTKYNPSWSERFQFLSAVKLESEATCINVLPFEDYEGFSKYIAVGDEHGRVFLLLPNGDVLVEFHTSTESSITAMLSYMSVYKNESVLVTGHKNGVILVHHIWEVSNGEDWHSLAMDKFRSFAPLENGEERLTITILELHQVGRMRYILASDVSGNIRVLRENGTVYGSATSKSRPLAFLKQRLLFLTESGAGSFDLRSMKIRESECEGMNRTLATNYVFDMIDRSKAYGFTSDGDLIHVVLLGDVINFKCRVRSKRKFEKDGALVFQAIKGYLLIVSEEKVFVYNISSQHYIRVGAPRPLFFASLDEIRSSFLNSHGLKDVPKSGRVMPLITTDREKLIVLGLGSGYVGMYRSNLPVFSTEFNTMLWTSPVLVFLVFLFGVWHFFGKKKESLTSWGTEDPFTSTSGAMGATVGSGSGDRPFADSSSRTSEHRDLRGGALRGPSRRYASPSRYPGGAAIPFRTSSTDPNFRTGSSDHNFRAASELKYRGAGLDTAGFPKRREIFPISQAVEENTDDIS